MMDVVKVDGYEITRADIVGIRDQVIRWRDESYEFWPESIGDTIKTTYLIGFLAGILEQYPGDAPATFSEFLVKYGHEEAPE